jgi:hypothetical protein
MGTRGKNHLILSHEPAWQRYANEVCCFLRNPDALGRSPTVNPTPPDARLDG